MLYALDFVHKNMDGELFALSSMSLLQTQNQIKWVVSCVFTLGLRRLTKNCAPYVSCVGDDENMVLKTMPVMVKRIDAVACLNGR